MDLKIEPMDEDCVGGLVGGTERKGRSQGSVRVTVSSARI